MITKINIGNVIPIYRIRIGHVVIYCKGNIFIVKRDIGDNRERHMEKLCFELPSEVDFMAQQ
jgi:hypothetical protein